MRRLEYRSLADRTPRAPAAAAGRRASPIRSSISGWRSYFDPQQRAVLLRAVDIAVAGVTRNELAIHHDLDRDRRRIRNDFDLPGRKAIERSNGRRRQRRGSESALISGLVVEHQIDGQRGRASVLAADHARDIEQFHACTSL